MKTHISKVVSSCYHQLRRIPHVRRLVGQDVAQQVATRPLQLTVVSSARVGGQLVHSASAACDECSGSSHNETSVKAATSQPHWLPVEQRIIYKLCLFMYHIHIGLASKYPSDCVSTVSAATGRYRLRSTGSAAFVMPRTRTRFGERGFFYSVQPPRTLFHPTFTTLLIPVNSESDSRMYFLIVLFIDYCWRSWTCRIAAPDKSRVD